MAKFKKTAEQAVKRAKAAGAQARREGGRLATRLASTTAKKTGKTVARVPQAGSCCSNGRRREDHRTHPEAEESQSRGDCCRRRRCRSSRRRGRGQPPQAVELTLAARALLPFGTVRGASRTPC